jgi:flagellar biogenesis protein FliO
MKFFLTLGLIMPLALFAQVDFKALKMLKSEGDIVTLELQMDGQIRGELDLKVQGTTISLTVPEAKANHFTTKKIALDNNGSLLPFKYAEQKDSVYFQFNYPQSIERYKSQVSAFLTDGAILLKVPKISIKEENKKVVSSSLKNHQEDFTHSPAVAVETIAPLKISKEFKKVSEKDLENFFNDSSDVKIAAKSATEEKDSVVREEINIKKSAPLRENAFLKDEKAEEKTILNYALKIIFVLTIMIAVIYMGAKFIKNKTVGKSNLALFDKLGSIQVLNTTLLAPKRHLHLIKAGDQLILIGSSDQGVHMLTEIKNPLPVLRDTETQMSGTNFEREFEQSPEKSFRLKETNQDIQQSKSENPFKENMKNKLKNLRPLNTQN